ncbi:MAG: TlpA family protein disulfide reductase, partial [Pseudopedobacter saltans]
MLAKWGICQTASIHFEIKNGKAKKVEIFNNDYSDATVMFKDRSFTLPLENGKANKSLSLSKPIFINAYYEESPQKSFNYSLYLSPGDNLDITFDVNASKWIVTGKGSENNQPLIQNFKDDINRDLFEKDSLPYHVLTEIQRQKDSNEIVLNKYVNQYKPTNAFIKAYSLMNQYFPLYSYIDFKGDHKYKIRDAYSRNENKWQEIEDSLTKAIPVDNKAALNIPNYVYFLPIYLIRIKERLRNEQYKDPNTFFKEWYGTDSIQNGMRIMNDDPENDLKERIINKYFSDKTAEFLYAIILQESFEGKQDNIPEIYERFKIKYPHSQYTPYIEPEVQKIIARRNKKITDNMVLIENTDSLQTFNDILKLVKGKTVLLDMWGTWCEPCRAELLAHSESIKNHFK